MLDTATEAPAVRWLIADDLPEVMAIENASFNFPWRAVDFTEALRVDTIVGAVAERDGRLVGYVLYEVHRCGIEVLRLAVAPAARRRGVGRALVERLLGKLNGRPDRALAAVVNESNLAAQLWFRALGFRALRVLRGYFDEPADDPAEDGYCFARAATERASF